MGWNWWGTTNEAAIVKPFRVPEYPNGDIAEGVYYPWLEGPVIAPIGKDQEREGIHHNNIYNNTFDIYLAPGGTAVEKLGWGRVKSELLDRARR